MPPMPPRRSRLRTRVLVPFVGLALALPLAGSAGLAPAHADDTPAPVAVDDTFTIPGRDTSEYGFSIVDVLANDTAAEGEELDICRLEQPRRRGLSVFEMDWDEGVVIIGRTGAEAAASAGDPDEGDRIGLSPWRNRAGTYTFTYWACDTHHLSPATVTVIVEKSPVVSARKTSRPGRVRFTNPTERAAVVLYGGIRAEEPDGRVSVPAGGQVTVRVTRQTLRWVAFGKRRGGYLGDGVVRGIDRPGADSRGPVARADVSPRLQRAWGRSAAQR